MPTLKPEDLKPGTWVEVIKDLQPNGCDKIYFRAGDKCEVRDNSYYIQLWQADHAESWGVNSREISEHLRKCPPPGSQQEPLVRVPEWVFQAKPGDRVQLKASITEWDNSFASGCVFDVHRTNPGCIESCICLKISQDYNESVFRWFSAANAMKMEKLEERNCTVNLDFKIDEKATRKLREELERYVYPKTIWMKNSSIGDPVPDSAWKPNCRSSPLNYSWLVNDDGTHTFRSNAQVFEKNFYLSLPPFSLMDSAVRMFKRLKDAATLSRQEKRLRKVGFKSDCGNWSDEAIQLYILTKMEQDGYEVLKDAIKLKLEDLDEEQDDDQE